MTCTFKAIKRAKFAKNRKPPLFKGAASIYSLSHTFFRLVLFLACVIYIRQIRNYGLDGA